MRRKTTALLLLLVMACAPACGVFATKREIVFVREDLDLNGNPRQILKVVEPTECAVAYFDGTEWIVVEDVMIPAGWLVVSPKLEDER